jgi:hypothetical protein
VESRVKAKPLPPVGVLHALFSLDRETGVLTWNVDRRGHIRRGMVAGSLKPDGRRTIKISQRVFKAHRIVYAMAYGVDPGDFEIDHKDGDNTNNAPDNLRPATTAQNGQNRQRHIRTNTTGHRNVYWDPATKSWLVHVTAFKKVHHIGRFRDQMQAVEAAHNARVRLHREFAS